MKNITSLYGGVVGRTAALVASMLLALPVGARILDDFNDNTKTGWTDFTFVPGFGLPVETTGQLQFELPPAQQDIFTATQKTSEMFDLREGRTIEFRVDLVSGSGEDAFAVLAFIPNTGGNNPGTLAGYSIAKDPTDVVITKGINKYFIDDDSPAASLPNENVTLVLRLTAKGGNVIITGKVLDKANGDAVLWERTFIDTPGADVMGTGTDTNPSTPFITTGYFTLYCFQQYSEYKNYSVVFDNAEVFVTDEVVLDDFNDNTKTDWADFTFVPGFGIPTEENGEFHFDLPPANQDIFTASQKISRLIELKEGEQVTLQVDLVAASGIDQYGEDAFAVLGFIPNTGGNNPGTLAGYALAKDPTDVLITKGIMKYFIADDNDLTATLKNQDVSLVLTLTVHGGKVEINGKIIDKADNSVLWSRTVVDTPAADVMQEGTDSPAAPYITTGYFTLYCYQQFNGAVYYSVYYDNAVLWAPPAAANTAPIISEVQPTAYGNFLPSSTKISFKVSDDQPLQNELISITLNGTVYTTANGLEVTGSGTSRTVSLGGLVPNMNYVALLKVEDSGGLISSRELRFDTFLETNLVIEVEDYNYGGGQFIDNPIVVPEGGFDDRAYSLREGVAGVDFYDTRTSPNADCIYRTSDPIRMAHALDHVRAKYTAAGGSDYGVYDYVVVDIAAGEWMQYTRTFPAGNYEVYLREGLANMDTGESVLEEVLGDPTQPNPETKVLGSFLGARTGFQFGNFPLTDGAGLNKIILQLSGVKTFRLRQVTPDPSDGARYLNYLIFVPATGPGVDRAAVTSVSPSPGETLSTVVPVINAVIENRATSVKTETIKLELNGKVVDATVTPTATGATIQYAISPVPPSGSLNEAKITFRDSEDVEIVAPWQFTITYLSLDPANRQPGPGKDRGFNVRVTIADPSYGPYENSLERAELQLAQPSTIPSWFDTNLVVQLMEMSQDGGVRGLFSKEIIVPGLEEGYYGTDDFAVEATAWLELAPGAYRFTVISDDGFKVSSGNKLTDKTPVLGVRNGGTANEVSGTFEFLVTVGGFYPFRLVWYERGGDAYVEWSSVNLSTGVRTLINDTDSPIKAYRDIVPAPAIKVQSSENVATGYTDDTTAVIDTGAKRITIPISGTMRFFRLVGGTALNITSVQIQGGNLVLTYQ